MKIEVNLQTGFTENFKNLIPMQGKLKEYVDLEGREDLKKSIISEGIIYPTFIWLDGDVKYIWDGHGRQDIYLELKEDGYEIPELPVAFLKAKNMADAKLKLLKKEQDYRRKLTKKGLADFILDEEIVIGDLEGLNLPGLGEIDFDFLDSIVNKNMESKGEVSSANSEGKDYSGSNKEIDLDNFGNDLEHCCPRCRFEFNE